MSFDFLGGLKTRIFSRSPGKSTLKGSMHNIIVVKPPDPMFTKAVFFLRDDYFMSSDISRAELLSQAEEAAAGFVMCNIPAKRRKRTVKTAFFTVLAIVLLFVFYFICLP